MSSVAARTRSKPAVRLVFRRPRRQVHGKLLLNFGQLRKLVEPSWEDQAKELRMRLLVERFVSEQFLPVAQGSSAHGRDVVMKTEEGNPVIGVHCTEEVARALQFKVFILLRRLQEDQVEGKTSARRVEKVSSRSRIQVQLSNGRGSSSIITNTSRGGGSNSTGVSTIRASGVGGDSSIASSSISSSGGGSAAGFPLVEDPASGLGSTAPSPLPEEVGGSTLDDLELSDMPVQELFPELQGVPAVTGDSLAGAPAFNIFDRSAGSSEGGDNHNPLGLSEKQLLKVTSPTFVADLVVAAAAANDNNDNKDNDDDDDDDDTAAFLDDIGSVLSEQAEEEEEEGWKRFLE